MSLMLVQALRYVVVGLASNAFGYVLYLLLTWFGMAPKTAMTLLYAIGTLQTFVFNKRWSFEYRERDRMVLARYICTYFIGYLANLAALIVFVERAHYPHYIVQAVMIFVIAAIVFTLQKFWVFAKSSPTTHQSEPTS